MLSLLYLPRINAVYYAMYLPSDFWDVSMLLTFLHCIFLLLQASVLVMTADFF